MYCFFFSLRFGVGTSQEKLGEPQGRQLGIQKPSAHTNDPTGDPVATRTHVQTQQAFNARPGHVSGGGCITEPETTPTPKSQTLNPKP